MSDPSNTDSELDQYGVWVKKEVQNEKSADLPIAGEGDPLKEDSGDTDASGGTDSAEEAEPADTGGDAEEVLSLDDFFSDDDESSAPRDASPADGKTEFSPSDFDAAGAEDGEISLDSFFGEDDGSPASMEVHTEETEIEDEEPLDIDLEFDDSVNVTLEDETAEEVEFDLDAITDEGTGSPAAAADGTESVDFSDFFSDGDGASAADIPEKINEDQGSSEGEDRSFDTIFNGMDDAEKQASGNGPADAGSGDAAMESVDLSDFESPAAPAADSEEIDLSDFGVDGSDDSMGGVKNGADDEDDDEDIKSNFDISVSADDDIGDEGEETNAADATDEEVSIARDNKQPVHTEERQAPVAGASQDDDFDVDSLLDSIEDETAAESGVPAEGASEVTEVADAAGEDIELPPLDMFEAPESEATDLSGPADAVADETDTVADAVPEMDESPVPEADQAEMLPERTLLAEEGPEAPDGDGQEAEEESFIPVPIPVSEETETEREESLARNEEIDYSDSENATDDIPDGEAEVDEEDMDGMNEILKQIAAEISSLKQEIQGLKSEFDDMKKNASLASDETERTASETISDTEAAADGQETDDLIPIPSSDNAESNFFSKDDDMDDVALDGSELNNILGNAELSEEAAEPVQDLADELSVEPPQEESATDERDRALSEPLPPPADSTNDELMNDDVALSPDELGGIFDTADVTEETGLAETEPAGTEAEAEAAPEAETEPVAEAEPEAEAAEEIEGSAADDGAEETEVEELSIPIVDDEETVEEAEVPELAEETAGESLEEIPAVTDEIAEETVETVEAEPEVLETVEEDTEDVLEEIPAADEIAEESLEPLPESLENDETEGTAEEAEAAVPEEAEEPAAAEEGPVDIFEEADTSTSADSGEEVTVLPVEEAGEGADMSRAAPAESIIETEEQPLTEENISYLESENAPAMDEESGSRQDDEEAEISEEPVEEVFNDWGEGAVDDGSGTEPGAEAASDDTESVPGIEESEVAGNDAPVLEAGVAVLDEEAAGEDTAAPVMEAEVAEESHAEDAVNIPENMKEEIKSVLSYMDQLLESLPEDKISQFAKSEEFNTYKKLFKELGLA